MLLCKYNSYALVVKVNFGFRYDDLVNLIVKNWRNLIVKKWKNLSIAMFSVSYGFSRHHNCALKDNDDFDNML